MSSSSIVGTSPYCDSGGERLRRGVFTSVSELVKAIDEYVAHHNKEPKPFIWSKSARDILQKGHSREQSLKFQTERTLH